MKIELLLVEDSDHKRVRVKQYLADSHRNIHVDEAVSFNGACKALEAKSYDFVLMDLSLPTYDRTPKDSGGRFRTLGGQELARKMKRGKLATKIIFFTQYDSFSDSSKSHTLDSLQKELASECGDTFGGLVYFDSSKTNWKEKLGELLNP